MASGLAALSQGDSVERAMYVRDEGAGVPVLLLHGLGASSRVFDAQFDARPEGVRLVAVDLPRMGHSGAWAPSTPEAIASALVASMRERHVWPAHVVGHSFGGLVALAMAQSQPEAVLSLTLASAPVGGLPMGLELLLANPFTDLAYATMGQTFSSRAMLDSFLAYIWGRPEELTAAQVAVYHEARRAPGFGQGLLEAMRAIGRFRPDMELLRQASMPKRVLWGDRDPLVSPGQGAAFARAIGAAFEVIEGAGHCLPDERPDAVRRVVRECAVPGAELGASFGAL